MGLNKATDLQGFKLDYSIRHEYLFLTCTACKDFVDSWETSIDLADVIEAAQEHKRADLRRQWNG